jgi:hypothetical protein
MPSFKVATMLAILILCPRSKGTRYGRAVALAVSRRLPIVAARVRNLARSCGICSGHRGNGTGFLRVLQFVSNIYLGDVSIQQRATKVALSLKLLGYF